MFWKEMKRIFFDTITGRAFRQLWENPCNEDLPPITKTPEGTRAGSIVHKSGAGGFLNLDNDYGINER